MNKIIVILSLGLFCCIACDRLSQNKALSSEEFVIDFSTVDVSPCFKSCQHLIEQERTNCFEQELHQVMQAALSDFHFTKEFLEAPLTLVIQVSAVGELSLVAIEPCLNDKTFYAYLEHKLQRQPKLLPALKRGVPVKVQYTIPLRVK